MNKPTVYFLNFVPYYSFWANPMFLLNIQNEAPHIPEMVHPSKISGSLVTFPLKLPILACDACADKPGVRSH